MTGISVELYGGDGNDTLYSFYAGTNAPRFTGEKGRDTFEIGGDAEWISVSDFSPSEDTLTVSNSLLALPNNSNNNSAAQKYQIATIIDHVYHEQFESSVADRGFLFTKIGSDPLGVKFNVALASFQWRHWWGGGWIVDKELQKLGEIVVDSERVDFNTFNTNNVQISLINSASLVRHADFFATKLQLLDFSDTGLFSSDSISNDKLFSLGLAERRNGDTVEYQKSNDGGTSWISTSSSQELHADGVRTFRAQITDSHGKSRFSTVQSIAIDSQSPNPGRLAFAANF